MKAKPAPVTRDGEIRALCDQTFSDAAEAMVANGASVEMCVDRMMTYCVAQVVATHGVNAALDMLMGAVVSIGRGEMDHLEFTNAPSRVN